MFIYQTHQNINQMDKRLIFNQFNSYNESPTHSIANEQNYNDNQNESQKKIINNQSTPNYQKSIKSNSSKSQTQKKYILNPSIIQIIDDHQQKSINQEMVNSTLTYNSSLIDRQLSLEQKILENKLRLKDDEYQNILIHEKQLEIQLISKESEQKKLNSQFKKQRHQILKKKQQLQKLKIEAKEKKTYLKKYYDHLETKFNENSPLTKSIIQKMNQLDVVLENKYAQEQRSFSESLIDLQHEYSILQQKHVSLVEKYQSYQKQVIQAKNSEETGDIRAIKEKLSKKEQNQLKREEFKKTLQKIELQKQRQLRLQDELKMLKKMLNIEEQHKKHSLVIENGIKKYFRIRLRELAYKSAVGQQYGDKIEDLRQITNKRKLQKLQLIKTLESKEKERMQLKRKSQQLIIEYSQLENRVMTQKNKRN